MEQDSFQELINRFQSVWIRGSCTMSEEDGELEEGGHDDDSFEPPEDDDGEDQEDFLL
jgi:hypothetical protein